jgi:hypothetical protein
VYGNAERVFHTDLALVSTWWHLLPPKYEEHHSPWCSLKFVLVSKSSRRADCHHSERCSDSNA